MEVKNGQEMAPVGRNSRGLEPKGRVYDILGPLFRALEGHETGPGATGVEGLSMLHDFLSGGFSCGSFLREIGEGAEFVPKEQPWAGAGLLSL